ncbi:MAG: DUF1684 domain-containing protein [Bacteroidota bacterium]
MRFKVQFMFTAAAVLLASGCDSSNPAITDEAGYLKSIEVWQQTRLDRLKGEDGWLNLAGLYWLNEGENSFGSDSSNEIVFPEKACAFCGSLTLKQGDVILHASGDAGIACDDSIVSQMELNDDQSGNTTYLHQGDLVWHIIRRGDKYGIRLRDLNHPRIGELEQIPSYPVSTDYVVEATLLPFQEAKTMVVATPVEGFTESYQCPGILHFRLNRKDLELYPFTSGNGYFLVIADETTGVDTYGAGRFMVATPDSTGRIILDFNKAYNPPCAFSPFATCPMPPKENFLDVAIEAGEKSVHLF